MVNLGDERAGTGNENDSFLKSLDARLHYVHEGTGTANRSGHQFLVAWDLYHRDQKLTEEELARIRGLLNTAAGDYAIYPANTGMGFSAGLVMLRIGIAGMRYAAEKVLQFIEKQLPTTVSWSAMAELY